MFLSLGVLQLANKQADCPTVTDANGNISYTNCGNKVYGMLPSSILSLMAIIGGVATSCFMPYAGAVSEKKNAANSHDLYISHLSLTHTLLFKSILPPPPLNILYIVYVMMGVWMVFDFGRSRIIYKPTNKYINTWWTFRIID